MLAKLIALLLQAKAGAISGVFLLGATGALISVSASNGVTTVTITEASPSPSASASPSKSPKPAVASPSLKAAAPLAPTTTTDCSAEAKAIAFQVRRVDSAFKGFHHDLEQLRKDHDKKALEASDKVLKEIRKSAVKAIHATKTCKHDDEDKDEDDKDSTTSTEKDSDEDKDEDKDKEDQKKSTTSGLAFSGTAESIATQAIAAMQAAFDTAKAAPAATHKPENKSAEGNKPHPTKRPEAKHKG